MELSIPEPCKMSLTDMKPIVGGYHCDACAHSVIDFRNMSTDEIKTYFKQKKGERVCGIITTPKEEIITIYPSENTFYRGISKLFFIAVIFTFANLFTGCDFSNPFEEQTVEVVGIMESPPKPIIDSTPTIGGETRPVIKDFIVNEKTEAENLIEKQVDSIEPIIAVDDTLAIIENTKKEHKDSELNYPYYYGTITEKQAEFPGGHNALYKFLRDNIVYPDYESKNNITGIVYVNFTINVDGKVENPKIMRGVEGAPNFNDEVLRVIKMMPDWKPSKQGGTPVSSFYNLPIEFSRK